MALEVAGVLERARHNAGAETERRVVGDGERLVVVVGADHRGDGPEDLLAVDAHRVVSLREQRRREIIAGLLAVETLAAPGARGTFLLADTDVVDALIELGLTDDRADIGPRGERVVDLQAFDLVDDRADE